MKTLSELSATELQKRYDREQQTGSKITDRMIAAGRGQERPSETRNKDDALSVEYNAHLDRHQKMVDEMRARETYHGSLKPIKKRAYI